MHRADLFRWRAFGASNRRVSGAPARAVTALLGVALTAFAPTASADVPDARTDVVSQEIEVRLAEIEVVVSDRQGDPVAGLRREDFRVFQDGRMVELTHFRAVGGLGPRAGEAAPEPAAPLAATAAGAEPAAGLHLVLYVDRGYLEPGDLREVRLALKDFLRQTLGPGDRVMLVTAAHSLELLHGFTSVPELVVSKLDQVRERPGGGRLRREYQSILLDMRRTKNEGNDLMARDPTRQARIFVSRIQAYAAEVEGEIRQTTAQLRQLIGSIAGLPGRRAVLYIGGRVPAAHGRQLFNTWEDTFGRSSNLQIPDDPSAAGLGVGGGTGADAASFDTGLDSLAAASASYDVDAQRLVQEAAETASAHGVVFHTLDAAGLRDPSFLAPGDATLSARGAAGNPGAVTAAGSLADSMASLRALAWGTGGRSFTGGRDFTAALARVGSDFKTYYSLGFEPFASKGETSKIEVRLHASGSAAEDGRGKLKVRHRSVLKLKDRDTLAAERTVSALLLEEIENPLGVEVSLGEPRRTDLIAAKKGAWRVPLQITVPLAKLALVADGRVHAGRLSIYTAAGSLDRVGALNKAVVPVRIPNRELLTSLGRRVAYELELILPAGPGSGEAGPTGQRIAVTVRDDFRPRSSTAVTTVGLPRGGTSGILRDPASAGAPGSR